MELTVSPNAGEDYFDSMLNVPFLPRRSYIDETALRAPTAIIARQQLVVIGNGFDLACRLKSSFGDFFKPRLESIRCIESDRSAEDDINFQTMYTMGFTAWDLALRDSKGSDWSNIEAAIAQWLKSGAEGELGYPTQYIPLIDAALRWESRKKKMRSHGVSSLGCPYNLGDNERRIYDYLLAVYPDLLSGYDRGKLNVVLLEELHRLERAFDQYLSEEVASSKEYGEHAIKLLDALRQQEIANEEDRVTETSVLSFNYTAPCRTSSDGTGDEGGDFRTSFVNIHGQLGREIIFGVDGGDAMSDPHIMPFTKTYRLMQLGAPSRYEVLPGDIDLIKFFGHSLSAADYSYFQAIFDHVDLYQGETRLVFYYRPYQGKTELEVRTEMMKRVIKLLTAYGRTLDNADHGNNLIHKLLLEGRLSVELLPED